MEVKTKWSLHWQPLIERVEKKRLTGFREENNRFRQIWTTQTSLKIKVHVWLSFHERQRLLTANNRAKSGILIFFTVLALWGNPGDRHTYFPPLPFSSWIFGCRKEVV